MKRMFTCLVITILATACSSPPSAELVQTAIAQTTTAQIPTETPIPTPIPLADIDLSTYLFQDGDLPAGVEPGQIAELELDKWKGAINVYSRKLTFNNDSSGNIYIYLFENEENAIKNFDSFENGADTYGTVEQFDDIGQMASIKQYNVPLVGGGWIRAIFANAVDCHALVYIGISDSTDFDGVRIFLKRTVEHIQPFVCQ